MRTAGCYIVSCWGKVRGKLGFPELVFTQCFCFCGTLIVFLRAIILLKLNMNSSFSTVAAYDKNSATLLYGMYLQVHFDREHISQLRVADLENYCGPHLQLKDGTPILPDSAGYSYVRFPPGELVEIIAPAPPADALESIFVSLGMSIPKQNAKPSELNFLNVFHRLGCILLDYAEAAFYLAAGDKKND